MLVDHPTEKIDTEQDNSSHWVLLAFEYGVIGESNSATAVCIMMSAVTRAPATSFLLEDSAGWRGGLPAGLIGLACSQMLTGLARVLVKRQPGLFNRLGSYRTKRFLIEPTDLPVSFILTPGTQSPVVRVTLGGNQSPHDARITGPFLMLLRMIDGQLDGDAMFFSRTLAIEGQVEAVVCLRNALDDLDGSVFDELASAFGRPGRIALRSLRRACRAHAGSDGRPA